jgi:putative transposase
MARRQRFLPVGIPAHIIHRGVNRQICFASDEDIAAYVNWLKEGARKYGVLIHAWVVMTNHVHLILTPTIDDACSFCMQYIGRHYVRYFNYRYQRTGPLFEGRFRSHPIQEDGYYLNCSRYIELNPVRAGIVNDPREYRWSSYCAQALGLRVDMWTAHSQYQQLGNTKRARQIAYRRLFDDEPNEALIHDIKRCQKTGFVLGTEKFRRDFEKLTGQPQSHQKRGPKTTPQM